MSNIISALVTILLIGIGISVSVFGYKMAGLAIMLAGVAQPIVLGDFWDKVFDGKANNPAE